MSLRVYDTLTREKQLFAPVKPGKVGMYLCGPTVYKPPHIGHMVGPVIFDAITSVLQKDNASVFPQLGGQAAVVQPLDAPGVVAVAPSLRARLDLDQGRLAHAAIGLEDAFAAAIAELEAEGRQALAIRVAELRKLQPQVVEQARAALAGSEGEPDADALDHALGRLEAALRARTASGFNLS